MHTHETIKCKKGEHIVAQCRCIEGSKNIRYIECCEECFKKPIISTNNRIREEFLKFIESNKIPWGQYAKTESIISADFFLSKIDELLKSQKEESHETKDGYCCACDYDIARFEGKLKSQEHKLREEIVEKILEKQHLVCDCGNKICPRVENFINLIKK